MRPKRTSSLHPFLVVCGPCTLPALKCSEVPTEWIRDSLHETHTAIPTHQIACLAQGAFFGNELDDATTGQSIPQKP
jgi:hypothetical protein